MFYPLVVSVLSAFGAAVMFVEKGERLPFEAAIIRPLRSRIEKHMPSAGGLFDCPVCLSFWTALVTDAAVWLLVDRHYFLWPLSGFIVMGMTWVVYELLPPR